MEWGGEVHCFGGASRTEVVFGVSNAMYGIFYRLPSMC